LLETVDSGIDSRRRKAEGSRNDRGSGATLIGADYLVPLFSRELFTYSHHGGRRGRERALIYWRMEWGEY
jgi:hypothetical protein